MIEPGMHESAAGSALYEDNTADAQVYALLAIASAVNRLADAVDNLAVGQQ